jgi:glyoxylase-like metal-dependent hydrolase (beta-lactamase superfamily II)/rhodanese-related sulfurtransferase
MYFKQFYLGCLAHASYLIGSEGEAAVVDPQRDVDQYVAEAEANGFKIKYVIETHLHADFVSGHRELAARAGAEIVFSHYAGATFPHRAVKEGEVLRLGKVELKILETPGHTPESISILVTDSEDSTEPQKILTGDTLFVGDVGRPDLAGGKGYTPTMMAEMMYDTLHNKILKLPDEVEVYPAHGAGSMCGKNMSKETSSTIGQQRKFNYALQPMSKAEFVGMMTTDLPPAPDYFPRDAEINRGGAEALSNLPPVPPLSAEQVRELMMRTDGSCCTVLDVRSSEDFGEGHVPGSINVGLGGQFAIWAGSLIPLETPLIIVAESEEKIAEARMRLARVGLENVKGYLQGGVQGWCDAGFEVKTVPQVSVDQLHDLIESEADLQVLDVRRSAEYESGHVGPAVSAPLADLRKTIASLKVTPAKKTAVICAGGYRSSAASSLLEQLGFTNLLNVKGGTGAWIKAGYDVKST